MVVSAVACPRTGQFALARHMTPRIPGAAHRGDARAARVTAGRARDARAAAGLRGELLEHVDALPDPLLQLRLHRAAEHRREAVELRRNVGGGLALPLADELDLLLGAAVGRLDDALDLERLLHELLELVEVAAAAVVGALRVRFGREVLDRRVALDVVVRAQVGLDGAVDVGDDDGGGRRVLFGELVPSWFHRFAVASPRREELDESVLARVLDLGLELSLR